ncbi:hypothetical protein DV738_g3120, partial [Chaetothyriales sp. CBS 135597]
MKSPTKPATSLLKSQPRKRLPMPQQAPYPADPPVLARFLPAKRRSRDSQLPSRPLGASFKKKKDAPEPVPVPDPLEEDMQKHRRSYMTLRPMNTLNDSPASSYHARPFNRTTRLRHVGLHPMPRDVRDSNDSIPNKKQRTGPSPKDVIQETPVNGSLETDQHTRRNPSRLLRRGLNLKVTESTSVKHAPESVIIMDSQPQDNGFGVDMDSIQDTLSDAQGSLVQTRPDTDGDQVRTDQPTGRLEGQSPPSRPTKQYPVTPTPAKHPPPNQDSIERYRLSPDESPDPLQQPVKTWQSLKEPTRIGISEKLTAISAETPRGGPTNKRISNTPGRKSDAVSSSCPGQPKISAFVIRDIAGFYVLRKQDYYLLYIDHSQKTFWIGISNPTIDTDPVCRRRPLTKIIKILHGSQSSKLHVKLSMSHDEFDNDFVIELESQKKVCGLLGIITAISPAVRLVLCEDARLDLVFDKKIQLGQDITQAGPMHGLGRNHDICRNQVHPTELASTKRNNLGKEDHGESCDQSKPEVIRGTGSLSGTSHDLPPELEDPHTSRRSEKRGKSATGLRSEYFSPRTTRSTRSTIQLDLDNTGAPPPAVPFSKRIGLGPQWSRPLVYPKESKKREIVEYCDLLRLDEDQFLNDSLISFFMRYLQYQLELSNPGLLKKMHFFNTYFFDTLTKNSKGRKDVNHAGVARWTKNIDIFSRDFVVVPVNDNLHWYLAIICNLSAFTKARSHDGYDEQEHSADGGGIHIEGTGGQQLPEVSQDAPPGQLQRIHQTRQIFQELTIQDTHNVTVATSPETKEPSQVRARTSPARLKSGRGKKHKLRKSLPRYDPETPIIISLDSLGQARGSAVSALKQYVVLEAKDKKDLDIDREDLKGMTAKGIPSQSNYTDCGLYMCMYLEQFVADPYAFVKKILQREDADFRWPHKIQSDQLRSRLRQLILDLHHQQEGYKLEREIPSLGHIMVEPRNQSPDVIASTPPIASEEPTIISLEIVSGGTREQANASLHVEHVDAELQTEPPQLDQQGNRITKTEIGPTSPSSQRSVTDEVEKARRLVDHIPSNVHSPIRVDDSPERLPKRPRLLHEPASLKKPFKTQDRVHTRWNDNDDPIVDENHSTSPDRSRRTTNSLSDLAGQGLSSSFPTQM